MKKETSRRIIKKWQVLIFIGGISMLLVLGAYLYYSTEERTIRDNKQQEIKAIAGLKISQITQWRSERTAGIKIISQSTFVVQMIKQLLDNTNNLLLEKEIKGILFTMKTEYGYKDIILASPKGDILLALDSTEVRLNPATSSIIIEAAKRLQITFTDFYYCSLHKKIHYDIIAPVVDSKNNPIAALLFRIDPNDYLYPLIESWPTPSKTSETLLVRKDGDNVQYVNNLRKQNNTALNLRIPLTRKGIPAVQAVLGFKGIYEGKDYRGVDVLAYIEAVPGTPWFMVAKVDKSEIYAELQFRAVFIGLFTIVLILLTVVIMIMIYNSRQKNIYRKLLAADKVLLANQVEYKTTLYSIGDGVIITDISSNVKQMNPVAEQLTGWFENEATGKPLDYIFRIINEETRDIVTNPVQKVLSEGLVVGLANHTLLVSKNGIEIPIADSGAPIKTQSGEIIGVVLVFRDQTQERTAGTMLRDSEAKFRSLFEHSPIGKSITGIDGSIHVNNTFCEMLGYSEEELKSKKWQEISYPDDIQPTTEIIQSLLDGKSSSVRFEKRFLHNNGNIVWTDVSSYLQRDEKGEPQYFITAINDITERKHNEEILQKQNVYIKMILDNFPIGIAVNELDSLNVTYMNRKFSEIYGWPKDEFSNVRYFFEKVFPDVEYRQQTQTRIMADISSCDFERMHWDDLKITMKSGEQRIVNAYNIPMFDQNLMVSTVQDVTERKQLEKAAQIAQEDTRHLLIAAEKSGQVLLSVVEDEKLARNEIRKLNQNLEQKVIERTFQLEVANKELEAFSYSVSHDLRAPLRHINGFIDMLTAQFPDSLPEKGMGYMNIIRDSARQMGLLIDDLLQFSRTGRQELRKAPAEMNLVFKEVLKAINQDTEDRKIEWITASFPLVYCDQSLIKQVWVNLISNAVKFTRKKEKTVIEVGCEENEKEFVFFVRDNGVGFDMKYANKLFGVFQRLHSRADYDGTGIGLANVQRIIHRHGGRVWAEAEQDKGAIFYFTLPKQKEEKQ